MSFFSLFEFISVGWYLNFMILLFDIYWHQGLGSGGTGLRQFVGLGLSITKERKKRKTRRRMKLVSFIDGSFDEPCLFCFYRY